MVSNELKNELTGALDTLKETSRLLVRHITTPSPRYDESGFIAYRTRAGLNKAVWRLSRASREAVWYNKYGGSQ